MKQRYTDVPRSILWLIRGGTLRMGGPEIDSQPVFEVEVGPFYMSKIPVTNLQFEAFDPQYHRPPHAPSDRDPACNLSWQQAHDYCQWYGGIARKPMRLPSEIEWEYACRAQLEPSKAEIGEEECATAIWHAANSGPQVPPLEEKQANAFGLYAMRGGVWEWTGSPQAAYPLEGELELDRSGGQRVLRGGSFRSSLGECSASRRRFAPADEPIPDAGFRIVKSLH